MDNVSRWRDTGHLERAVATAGGREAFDAAVAAMLENSPVQCSVQAPAFGRSVNSCSRHGSAVALHGHS